MYAVSLLALAGSIGSTLALPQWTGSGEGGPPSGVCMTPEEAAQVGHLWSQLIGNYSTSLAQAALTSNYTDYSASALSLNSVCPQAPHAPPSILDPVFTSRTQFEEGQGPQKPIFGNITNVFPSCRTVTTRNIYTNIGSAKLPVVDIIAFEVVPAPSGNKYPWQIETTYSEFDVQAWVSNLKDIGAC